MSNARLARERRYADNLRRQDEALRKVAEGVLTVDEAARVYRVRAATLRIVIRNQPTNGS